jgi:hypothetical protein
MKITPGFLSLQERVRIFKWDFQEFFCDLELLEYFKLQLEQQ